MGIEIERKFRVHGDAWRGQAQRSQRMAQGYLNDAAAVAAGTENASVRIRIEGDAAWLNIKSAQLGHTRQEFDYAVPVADAQDLLALCVGGHIDKTRHFVVVGGHTWEVDEFHGDNAGLVVAEIELDDADEPFERPDWLGEEVTGLSRYYNMALSRRPWSAWSAEEKA